MSTLVIEACGPMSAFQDAGRFGLTRLGVSRSGAMDRLALAQANTLVGNAPGAGAIELVLAGATVTVENGPARLAVAGAEMSLALDGTALPANTSVTMMQGQRLVVGPARAGVFAYLAVCGGYDVAPALGSVSLQLRGAIGGLGGRALRAGDRIPLGGDAPDAPELALDAVPLEREAEIRVVLGPQADYFDEAGIAAFLGTPWTISAEADRMGYRLAGPALSHPRGYNIVSDGIVAGSVQVPGAGRPIVMMADHQTTGGYPKIATVISCDLRLIAQRRPGDVLRFRAVSVEEAETAFRERADLIARLPGRARPVRRGLPDCETLLALNLAGEATDAFAPAEP